MTAKKTGIDRKRVQAVRDRLSPPTEASLRARARRRGFQMERSRLVRRRRGFRMEKSRQPFSMDNYAHYRLIDAHGYVVLGGERFDATLAEIAEFLRRDDDD